MPGLGERLRMMWRRGLPPGSVAAYGFAVVCVAIAAAARFGLGLIEPGLVPFATFYPAVLLVALYGGVAAGIAAVVLSVFLSWWLFLRPAFSFTPIETNDIVNLVVFVGIDAIIIWTAESLRRARAQLIQCRRKC